MARCRLVAPHGSALVVCRHARQVELRDCWLTARASAICLDVEHDVTPEFRLVNTSVTVSDTRGAAISLWTSLADAPARARMSLEKNRLYAGRLLCVAGPL